MRLPAILTAAFVMALASATASGSEHALVISVSNSFDCESCTGSGIGSSYSGQNLTLALVEVTSPDFYDGETVTFMGSRQSHMPSHNTDRLVIEDAPSKVSVLKWPSESQQQLNAGESIDLAFPSLGCQSGEDFNHCTAENVPAFYLPDHSVVTVCREYLAQQQRYRAGLCRMDVQGTPQTARPHAVIRPDLNTGTSLIDDVREDVGRSRSFLEHPNYLGNARVGFISRHWGQEP